MVGRPQIRTGRAVSGRVRTRRVRVRVRSRSSVKPSRGGLNVAQRFLQLAEVSGILNISSAQASALVRSGELPAIKIGGRGQWRVEATELESYIQRMYAETKDLVTTRGETGDDVPDGS